MQEIKVSKNIINIFIFLVTLVSLSISYQITSNNYKDNKRYSQAYFLMNKHNVNIHQNYTDNKMYYLVDSPRFTGCKENGHLKYYLLNKKEYAINERDSALSDKQYSLLSCEKLSKYDNLGITKKEKGYYVQQDRTLNELLNSYRTTIGGMEPMYILLSYISSSVLDYNNFILLMNLVFLLVVFLALKKFTKNYKYMYVILVSFDFYFYIYLSNTHRLKLAIIFFLLSYLAHNKTKIAMIVSALFSHFQILIFYLYYLIVIQIKNNKLSDIVLKKKKYDIYMILAFVVLAFALGLVSREIISKISYYLQMEIPYKVGFIVLIYLVYLFVFKLRDTVKIFVPLALMILIISFFIGSGRVNFMIMEFIFIVELNRLLNRNWYSLFAVIPFILYSFYKSLNYIEVAIQSS